MKRLFWRDGRLGWPPVIFAVYMSAFLLAFDYSWRVMVIPFDTLIICAALLGILGAVLIGGLVIWCRKAWFLSTH